MNKEQIVAAAKLLAEAADSIEEWAAYASPYFQNKHDLQGDLVHYRAEAGKLVAVAAQLEKALEPVYQININGTWTQCSDGAYEMYKKSNYDGRILYTSPPDVAELVKQNVELLHRVVDLKSLYESASKANEQAHVALAESQHKVTDLQKQVQALQAENEKLQNVADLARFLANTWVAIDKFVYANVDDDAIDKYPVIQGTSNQINLAKIGAQKYTNTNLYAAIAYLLKEKS